MGRAGSALHGSTAGALNSGLASASLRCWRSHVCLTHVYRIIYTLLVEGCVHKVMRSSTRRHPNLPGQSAPVPGSARGHGAA